MSKVNEEDKKGKYITESDFLEQMLAESYRCSRAIHMAEKALIFSYIEAVALIVILAKIFLFG